jgi:thermitase
MNGSADFVGDDNDDTPVYPASYNSPNIISVAASNKYDTLTSFSNYGDSVDLAAPGQNILSTLPNNRYGPAWGTSMATPHVAGVAALLKSQDPTLDDTQMKSSILNSVDKKSSLSGKVLTGGRLNAAKALGANTAPVIAGLGPRGKIRDRTPIITATVWDDETELTADQISLYLDGRLKQGFSYDQVEDKLTYRSRKLAPRRHRVQVVADDGQGLQESRTWKFMVVDRR